MSETSAGSVQSCWSLSTYTRLRRSTGPGGPGHTSLTRRVSFITSAWHLQQLPISHRAQLLMSGKLLDGFLCSVCWVHRCVVTASGSFGVWRGPPWPLHCWLCVCSRQVFAADRAKSNFLCFALLFLFILLPQGMQVVSKSSLELDTRQQSKSPRSHGAEQWSWFTQRHVYSLALRKPNLYT